MTQKKNADQEIWARDEHRRTSVGKSGREGRMSTTQNEEMNVMQSEGMNATQNEEMSTTQRDEKGRIMPRKEDDPEAKVELPGVGWFAEYEEAEARQQYRDEIWRAGWQRRSWEGNIPGRWCIDLYQRFQEYKGYLEERNPYGPNGIERQAVDYPEHKAFAKVLYEYEKLKKEEADAERERQDKLRDNLEKARRAARCEHVHTDGEQCGSPKMKDHTLCYMHARMEQAQATKLDLGPMEDADSIQLAIKKLQAVVIDGTLDASQVRQLAYLIQLAAWNVKGTTFGGKGSPQRTERIRDRRNRA
jgi:hypothetical protein